MSDNISTVMAPLGTTKKRVTICDPQTEYLEEDLTEIIEKSESLSNRLEKLQQRCYRVNEGINNLENNEKKKHANVSKWKKLFGEKERKTTIKKLLRFREHAFQSSKATGTVQDNINGDRNIYVDNLISDKSSSNSKNKKLSSTVTSTNINLNKNNVKPTVLKKTTFSARLSVPEARSGINCFQNREFSSRSWHSDTCCGSVNCDICCIKSETRKPLRKIASDFKNKKETNNCQNADNASIVNDIVTIENAESLKKNLKCSFFVEPQVPRNSQSSILKDSLKETSSSSISIHELSDFLNSVILNLEKELKIPSYENDQPINEKKRMMECANCGAKECLLRILPCLHSVCDACLHTLRSTCFPRADCAVRRVAEEAPRTLNFNLEKTHECSSGFTNPPNGIRSRLEKRRGNSFPRPPLLPRLSSLEGDPYLCHLKRKLTNEPSLSDEDEAEISNQVIKDFSVEGLQSESYPSSHNWRFTFKVDFPREDSVLWCPVCDAQVSIPEDGIEGFPSTDTLQGQLSDCSAIASCCENGKLITGVNVIDNPNSLIWCQNCLTLLCEKCSLMHPHKDHVTSVFLDEVHVMKTELQDLLKEVDYKHDEVARQIHDLSEASGFVKRRSEEVTNHINDHIDKYIEALEVHRHKLLRQVQHTCEKSQKDIMRESQKGQQDLADLEMASEIASQLPLHPDKQSLRLASYTTSQVKTLIGRGLQHPSKWKRLKYLPRHRSENVKGFKMYGILSDSILCPAKSILKPIFPDLGAWKDMVLSAFVMARDEDGQPITYGGETISGKLFSTEGKLLCDCFIQDREDGSYKLSFISTQPGTGMLHVTAGGDHMQGSPLKVVIQDRNSKILFISTNNKNMKAQKKHSGIYHCCTFCSSNGDKMASCGCGTVMPGGYRGCGHNHKGHPGHKHWSCCGEILLASICTRPPSRYYQVSV